MRIVDQPSWQFRHAVRDHLHEVLLVRDALSLPVGGGSDLPPRLTEVEAVSGVLDGDQLVEAASAWPSCWNSVLAITARHELQLGSLGDDPVQGLRTRRAERRQVFDPPDWVSLSDRPALRAAAQEVLARERRWVMPNRSSPANFGRESFSWSVVNATAESLIDELHVSPDALKGCAFVLQVEGVWWHIALPGVALSSYQASVDPFQSELIVREAFRSSIN